MFDDHLVVESPGKLPGLVRPDNIRTTHFSRNPKIAEFLKVYEFVKEFGEGVDRMCDELEDAGLKLPTYYQDAFILKATIYNADFYNKDNHQSANGNLSDLQVNPQVNLQVNQQVDPQEDLLDDLKKINEDVDTLIEILEYCKESHSTKEILEHTGKVDRGSLQANYLKPLIYRGYLAYTIPDKINSSKQKS